MNTSIYLCNKDPPHESVLHRSFLVPVIPIPTTNFNSTSGDFTMQTGTKVTINGRLYQGLGTVEAICQSNRIADILALPEKFQDKRREGQAYPQLWVRADNGTLYHYNGQDLASGVVTEYVPAPVNIDLGQVDQLHATTWTVTVGGIELRFTTMVETV